MLFNSLARMYFPKPTVSHVMRYIYSALFYAFLPLILLRQRWRARTEPSYGERWHERFAHSIIPLNYQQSIWLHAVSVGEYIASKPLLLALQKRYPSQSIVITTTTPAASARVRADFGGTIFHVYLPYDLPDCMARFLKRLQPKLLIVMETELWPNLFCECEKQRVPIVIANARLSVSSWSKYRFIESVLARMWPAVKVLAAQSEVDAKRFVDLGMPEAHVRVAGNLKFNQSVPEKAKEKGIALRQFWGADRLVWIAASTHEGEEKGVLAAHQKVMTVYPDALLVLVPRHPDRFSKVIQFVQEKGYTVQTRSGGKPNKACQVFIGDTMGEMMLFYAASDVAFVAGSLMPIGGHNPLEPIALGVPTLMGKYVFKMQAMASLLTAEKLLRLVSNSDELAQHIMALFSDPSRREAIAQAGLRLLADNQDALTHHLDAIKNVLENPTV